MSVHVIAGRLVAATLKTSVVRGGYDASYVDDVLDAAASALTEGEAPEKVAQRLKSTVFAPAIGGEGYDPQDVQRFVADIVARLERLDGDSTTVIPTVGGVVPAGLDAVLSQATFKRARGAGYKAADVDEFVDKLRRAVRKNRPAVEIATMADESQFAWTRRVAYDAADVDAFLDRIIGLLAAG